MGTTGGLRERKKEATRRALHEAAVRLAVEHGLERVTVEAIADAAGVSRRTFSNYFADKEDAVLYGDRQRVEMMLVAFTERPAGETTWTALRRAFHSFYDRAGEPDPQWAAQMRLARTHPGVLGRQLAHYAVLERRFAEEIRAREGLPAGSRRPRVLAAAFLNCMRLASQIWAEEQPSGPRRDLVDELLDEMARPFV